MTAKQRKSLSVSAENLQDILNQLDLLGLEEVANELKDIADKNQEKYDNLSEGLQQTERGQEMESAANDLSEAADELRGIDEKIQNALNLGSEKITV